MNENKAPIHDQILDRLNFGELVEHVRLPLCVTDPRKPDNPIVYINPAFTELTGYSESEVIGRNCRFLQGDGTTAESLAQVRRALEAEELTTIEIVNYRKDGSKFINGLQLGPIQDGQGKTVLFFGSQLDVTERRAAEIRQAELETGEMLHRLRNIVNVMAVVIRLTAREERDADGLATKLTERLHALGNAHFKTFANDPAIGHSLSELLATIAHAYAPLGAAQVEITPACDIMLPQQAITPLTLALHELATNAVKHGALSSQSGKIHIDLDASGGEDALCLSWTESGGPPVTMPDRQNGSKIIGQLLRSAGGEITYDWKPEGLVAEVRFSRKI